MAAAFSQALLEAPMSEGPPEFTARAAFDEFYASWLPRVYRFAAQRLASAADAEAATRAILEAAVRNRLVGADAAIAIPLLALAKAEIESRLRASA